MSPTSSRVERVVPAGGAGLRGTEALGGETSVEEAGHWGMGARVDSTVPLPVYLCIPLPA